jgi:hypothetical protein
VNVAPVLRAVLLGLAAYAVVLVVCLLPGGALDATEQQTALYAITIAGSLLGSAAGAAVGGRAGAAAVVVVGILLTLANGGTSAAGDALIYVAHPLGAAVGLVVVLRAARLQRDFGR